jgi:hypothetical protein
MHQGRPRFHCLIIQSVNQTNADSCLVFQVYAATPLIHRAVTSYTLEDLRPHTEYEVRIFLIPFPGQTTELIAERTTELLTADVHGEFEFLTLLIMKSTIVFISTVCFNFQETLNFPTECTLNFCMSLTTNSYYYITPL